MFWKFYLLALVVNWYIIITQILNWRSSLKSLKISRYVAGPKIELKYPIATENFFGKYV